MTLNAHATPEANVNLFRRKGYAGLGDRSAISPLRRALRYRGHSAAETLVGSRFEQPRPELGELLYENLLAGLLANGGLPAGEPLPGKVSMASALDEEDEDEEEDLDEEDDDLDEDDLEDEEDEDDLDDVDALDEEEDEDEYLDDEDEEDEEEE